jgi:hypothetical protein
MNIEIDTSAKSLYQTLLENASSPRFKSSLERVTTACDVLERQGVPITVAGVGHHCEGVYGGPKTQSVRNSKHGLALYVQKRAAEQTGTKPKTKTSGDRPVIENESIRAYVTTLEVQLDQANRELRRVREGIRQLQPLDPQGIGNILENHLGALPETGTKIPHIERNDLVQFLDPDRLASCGIKEIDGELEFASGLVLLQKDGLTLIKRLITDAAD